MDVIALADSWIASNDVFMQKAAAKLIYFRLSFSSLWMPLLAVERFEAQEQTALEKEEFAVRSQREGTLKARRSVLLKKL